MCREREEDPVGPPDPADLEELPAIPGLFHPGLFHRWLGDDDSVDLNRTFEMMNLPPAEPPLFSECVVKIAAISSLYKFHLTFPRGFVDRREQDEGPAIHANYTQMMDEVRPVYENNVDAYKFTEPPPYGAAVCVKVPSIDTHIWLRGTVDDVSDGGESGWLLEVYLIDYGFTIPVPLRDCRRWLQTCDTVPALAIQCTISGLNGEGDGEWDAANVEKLVAIAEKYSLVAVIKNAEDYGSLEVKFYATLSNPTLETGSVETSDLFFPVFNPETQSIVDPSLKE